ncbi:hypothetical protein R1sor_003490 [Riccia sorocarpa]|uniref:Uncharacterized protein n=1 Tax=Riccia sorocarpa TaxID=122646 RepID=A0ABD3H252_9MARC
MADLPPAPDIDSMSDKVELLSWDLVPGDCLVHQSFSVHGAPGISSIASRRRAYVTRWVGVDVRWDPRPGEQLDLYISRAFHQGSMLCKDLYDLKRFDEDGKLTIAMEAMRLRSKQQVPSYLAKFIAQKKKSSSKKNQKLSFSGHLQASKEELLDMVVDFRE